MPMFKVGDDSKKKVRKEDAWASKQSKHVSRAISQADADEKAADRAKEKGLSIEEKRLRDQSNKGRALAAQLLKNPQIKAAFEARDKAAFAKLLASRTERAAEKKKEAAAKPDAAKTALDAMKRSKSDDKPSEEAEKSIQTGVKGGRYYISKNGEKVYVK